MEDDSNIRETRCVRIEFFALCWPRDLKMGKHSGQVLKKVLPDIILMDIMLPDEDGISLKYLKKDGYI